jgi:hypothetical protein
MIAVCARVQTDFSNPAANNSRILSGGKMWRAVASRGCGSETGILRTQVLQNSASHCVRADGSADHGVFTFIGAALGGPPGGEDSQDSITGQYVAHVVPTANSVFPATPASPPGGYWLVYEAFCVWKGTGKYAAIANDCPTSTSPGRFFPARGSVDFDTGQANIYGTALVRVAFE